MDTPSAYPMRRRNDEVTRRRVTLSDYFDPGCCEYKLDGQGIIDGGHKLLLEWLLGAAVVAARDRTDRPIQALLVALQFWRGHVNKNRPFGADGPCLTLVGKIGFPIHATGSTQANWIKITVGIPNREPEQILTDPDCQNMRDQLVAELGQCFVHEGAHLWQLNKYDNDSHPWKRTVPAAPITQDWDPGIKFEDWPDPVKAAFNEFVGGGLERQAADLPEAKRLIKALNSDEYFRPATWDRRGRELVSHLIELVYRWNDPSKFAAVFPLGAALLNDVMRTFRPKLLGQ
jgi:hypothetical protein